MAIISNGVLVKSQLFTPASWNGVPQPGITLRQWGYASTFELGSYAAIYERQLWVHVLVKKIADAEARLPLKVYLRDDLNRPPAPADNPYAQLLRRPSSKLSPYAFWRWVRSTREIYGEAPLLKVRDRGGRPVELVPWHPTRLLFDPDKGQWDLDTRGGRVKVARHDFVLFRNFNPNAFERGLSPLEPLRSTLENEEGARRANSAMWRNGGRPSVALRHPAKLSDPAVLRLRANWDEVHGGVDNWAKAVVLEEGMEAQVMPLNVEELQYIEARKLNREEVCAVYDVPPTSVHINDHSTFNNITEQFRSFYRDSMAPKLKDTESGLEFELRDGRMGRDVAPDFGEDVYAEFLMDEVLRGDFEARAQAYSAADYMTMAEKRKAENLSFVPGTDRIFVNAATIPLDAAGVQTQPPALPALPPAQRAHTELLRPVWGRLSRLKMLDEVDLGELVAGLDDATAAKVGATLTLSDDLPDFRRRLHDLTPGG